MNLTEGKRYEPVSKAEMCKYDHKDVNTTFRGVFIVVSKHFISAFPLSLFRLCREECQIFSAWSFWYFTYIRSDRLNTVCICLELGTSFSCHSFFTYYCFRVSYKVPNFKVPKLRKNVPELPIETFLFKFRSYIIPKGYEVLKLQSSQLQNFQWSQNYG